MSWANAYVGRSASEYDCWGLVQRVYREVLGVELPSYSGTIVTAEERREVAALVDHERARPVWQKISPDAIKPFDVLVFSRGGVRSHVGLAVDAHRMLHVIESARVEDWRGPIWSRRLKAVYRHVEVVGGASL